MEFFDRLVGRTSAPVGVPMNGYNFTERVRKVLAMAHEEAARLRHEYVGTEHILLGLIREGEGVAAAVLDNIVGDAASVRERVLGIVQPGNASRRPDHEVPFTSRAKKALELAMAEARELNHSYVGTEHLLLGLVGEQKGIAAQVLVDVGASLEVARAETLHLLGEEVVTSRVLTPDAPSRSPRRAAVASSPPAAMPDAEAQTWQRLLGALDATARLGGTPAVTLEADGSLSVTLGPDLLVTVTLPPDARVRPRVP